MSSRKQDHAILICLAGFAIATVGFLLSVVATFCSRFTPRSSGQPIIKTRDAAVTASTRSPPNSPLSQPDSLPDKATPRRTASKHRARREKLLIDVKGKTTNAEHEVDAKLLSESPGLSPGATPTQHIVHFLTPTQEIPTIAVSPPPTRMSTQSDSSASTDNQTLSSESAASVDTSPPTAEAPRGRRLRFSKIVHLFSDKRGNSKPRRRDSLPSLRSGGAPRSSSPIPPVPPLPLSPTLSPIPFSPTVAPAPAPAPTSPTTLHSKPVNQRPTRRRSLIIRTASCPILRHHSHHGRCQSEEPVPPVPQSPFIQSSVKSPVQMQSPVKSPVQMQSPVRKSKAEKKEPVPRPRTHPYEAPYFIPPPDSVDVEEPLIRRRPSRRRTTSSSGS